MTVTGEMNWIDTIYSGDVRAYCRLVPPRVADMVVTSPPYYRQRVYDGVEPSVWGGFSFCDHDWRGIEIRDPNLSGGMTEKQSTHPGSYTAPSDDRVLRSKLCTRCGAWLGCLGNEPTVEQYVWNLSSIFGAIWRVLKPQGTVWLNIDGKYNGSGGAGGDYGPQGRRKGQRKYPGLHLIGYKHKDWIPVPWLVGIALQKQGWYLRMDRIWEKPNVFVESVKDRPTRCHEYILFFSKSRRYYYDYVAASVPAKYAGDRRGDRTDSRRGTGMKAMHGNTGETRNSRSVIRVSTRSSGVPHYATYNPELIKPLIEASCPSDGVVFDPFMGVGTTAKAARELGRHYMGCDASDIYTRIADQRLDGTYVAKKD